MLVELEIAFNLINSLKAEHPVGWEEMYSDIQLYRNTVK